MKPIILKTVESLDGAFRGLELHQGDQHITISLQTVTLHQPGYTWDELKKAVGELADRRKRVSLERLSDEKPSLPAN